MCTNRCLLYCGEGAVQGQESMRACKPQDDGDRPHPHDPEWWPRTTQTLPPTPRYRVRISLHLHEGGVFEEPQPGGGDGAVLPHGHRGRSGGERGQGLVTWEDKMDPGLNGVLCSYTQGCPCLCASWNGPAFGREHGMDSDSFARCPCAARNLHPRVLWPQ